MEKKEISTGTKLKLLRIENDLTQAQVAEKLGISQQTYSKLESKDADIDSRVLKRICEFYGVSADYLLNVNPQTKATNDTCDMSYNTKPLDNANQAQQLLAEAIELVLNKRK